MRTVTTIQLTDTDPDEMYECGGCGGIIAIPASTTVLVIDYGNGVIAHHHTNPAECELRRLRTTY